MHKICFAYVFNVVVGANVLVMFSTIGSILCKVLIIMNEKHVGSQVKMPLALEAETD